MINKRNFLLGISTVIFTIFEGIMFYLIHFSDKGLPFTDYYLCIIAAAVFSFTTLFIEIITAKEENERARDVIFSASNGNLIRIAMLFTLTADYFMVAIEEIDNQTGVTVFLGTQLFIFLHIFFNDTNKAWRKANIIVRLSLSVIIVAVAYMVLGEEADYLAIISVIYYTNLCSNAIFAHRIGICRGGIILTIGLILFALCDVNVGLLAINDIYVGGFPEGSLMYNLVNSELDLMWFFYIPSQTLIPITLLFSNNKQKQKTDKR